MNKDYKLINSKTKEETICNKVTLEDGFDYYISELPTHGRADGLGFKGHHFYHCRQFTLIFKSVFPTQIIF
jgi:hypothetical protein